MKTSLSILMFCTVFSGCVFAQTVKPQFEGGENALNNFIQTNLREISHLEFTITNTNTPVKLSHPEQTNVAVKFLVNKSGRISSVQAINSEKFPHWQREAVRLVMSMPKWIPGKIDDLPSPMYDTLYIDFDKQWKTIQTIESKLKSKTIIPPRFPGNDSNALQEYLSKNLRYPPIAAENGIQGRTAVSFTVGKDGVIQDVRIERGVDRSIDKEVTRVIKMMPNWIPGRENGRAISSSYTLMVRFELR